MISFLQKTSLMFGSSNAVSSLFHCAEFLTSCRSFSLQVHISISRLEKGLWAVKYLNSKFVFKQMLFPLKSKRRPFWAEWKHSIIISKKTKEIKKIIFLPQSKTSILSSKKSGWNLVWHNFFFQLSKDSDWNLVLLNFFPTLQKVWLKFCLAQLFFQLCPFSSCFALPPLLAKQSTPSFGTKENFWC